MLWVSTFSHPDFCSQHGISLAHLVFLQEVILLKIKLLKDQKKCIAERNAAVGVRMGGAPGNRSGQLTDIQQEVSQAVNRPPVFVDTRMRCFGLFDPRSPLNEEGRKDHGYDQREPEHKKDLGALSISATGSEFLSNTVCVGDNPSKSPMNELLGFLATFFQ